VVHTRPADAATPPPSVTFISSYGGLGGSEIYLERLLGMLDRSLVRSVISLGDGALIDRLRALGHAVEVVPTSGDPLSLAISAWTVRRQLRAKRPEVVHANGLKAAIVTALATTGTGLPVVWIRHDFSMEGWRAQALALRCRRVICVSHALARTFHGGLRRKVHVVHTGFPDVDVERDDARQQVRDLIAEPLAEPIISLVGHVIPGKGHLELIEVVPELLTRSPDARILFVGDVPSERLAPYAERLRDRVKQLGLEEATTFLGHRHDALTVIAGSDLVVMPSVSGHRGIETEGFPLLALEALALGTPIVAYAVGGLPELIDGCGALVPPSDREGLLDAILRLTTDRAMWERMSTCGRERARTSFSPTAMIAGMQRVYRLAAGR
jgi:glycosyltransferase involved in cell wall biosynthesis